jgi:hypothetical protein
MNYDVIKMQRTVENRWFEYPITRTFPEKQRAIAYALEFANDQKGIPYTRIAVRLRETGEIISAFDTVIH